MHIFHMINRSDTYLLHGEFSLFLICCFLSCLACARTFYVAWCLGKPSSALHLSRQLAPCFSICLLWKLLQLKAAVFAKLQAEKSLLLLANKGLYLSGSSGILSCSGRGVKAGTRYQRPSAWIRVSLLDIKDNCGRVKLIKGRSKSTVKTWLTARMKSNVAMPGISPEIKSKS